MENKCENCIASNMCEDVVGSCEKAISYANAIYNRALDDLQNELKNHYTDNVVDRLNEASYERFGNDGMGGELVVNLDDAIKIVKAGGKGE